MGVSLAKVALSATWAHLPPAARVLFAHMAIVAQDHAKRPIYFGGRDALVLALDGALHEDPDQRETQYRRLLRHLEVLKEAGAVELDGHAHRRRRAEYVLHVNPKGGHSVTPFPQTKGGHSVTPFVDPEWVSPDDTQSPEERVSLSDTSRVSPDDTLSAGKGVTERPKRVSLSDTPRNNRGTTKEEEFTGGGIEPVPAQPSVGAREAPQDRRERCAKCGRTEQDCRTRSARHGAHDYEPAAVAPLRLA